MLAFFSTDSRDLYKEDIYRVMSLPDEYVIHFRYRKHWIDLDEEGIKKTKDAEGIIFFSSGNKLDQEQDGRQLIHTSIRRVRVVDVVESPKTGLVHYYLKLGEFVECVIPIEESNKIPPKKFLSDLKINQITSKKWYERVYAIKESFPYLLFLNVSIEDKKNTSIKPIFNKIDKQSYFPLSDENVYQLNISFYDVYEETITNKSKDDNKFSLEIETNKNHIEIDINKKYYTGASKDDQSFSLTTQTLSVQSVFTSLKFSLDNKDSSSSFGFSIRAKLSRAGSKTLLFGIYSLLLASGVSLMTYLARTIQTTMLGHCALIALIVFACVSVWLGAQMLFKVFNKK